MNRRAVIFVTSFVAVALVIAFARSTAIDVDALVSRSDVWSAPWAPVAFVGAYALATTLMLPATPLTLIAGIVWGWWWGGVVVLAASTLGSFLPYLIARSGAPAAADFLERRAGRLAARLRREGFFSLLVMRLVPLFPYNVLNYAAGLAGIRARDYLAATFVGTIPAIFTYTFLADAIRSGIISPRDAFVRIVIAGALIAVLSVGGRLLARRLRRPEDLT